MVWRVNWDRGFVIGGDASLRLTPNFRLREFLSHTGTIRVHRELVSALQLLRERLGKPLSVSSTDEDGLGALISSSSMTELLATADAVKVHRLFETVAPQGESIHVRIPDPTRLPDIALEQALETAFSVTSSFETSGDRFQQVTGNFDGAGISFGPVQWNFKSETLVPLFEKFESSDPTALRACFTDQTDWQEWVKVTSLPVAKQVAWADGISTGRGKHDVVDPWKGYFQAVGSVEKFRVIMVEEALRKYGAKVLESVRFLQTIAPAVEINHLRCLCALYDLAIQQGSLKRARTEIEERVRREKPTDQFALVGIAVEERGRKANPRWRADCISRRLGILTGVPQTVDGHQRANLSFYKLRDVRIERAHELLSENVDDQLARASTAIASGDILLT